MAKLPPIPPPPGHYWYRFRVHLLPVLAFGMVFAGAILTWDQYVGPHDIAMEGIGTQSNVATSVPESFDQLHPDGEPPVANAQAGKKNPLFTRIERLVDRILQN